MARKIKVKFLDSDTVVITDFRTCLCRTVGRDDGDTTCWKHHDCSWGECTHQDNMDDWDQPIVENWPAQDE